MQTIDPKEHDKFAPKRLDWQDLCRVPLDIAIHTKYKSCGPHGYREFFFHYKSMGVIDLHSMHGQFGPQLLDWQDLSCGAIDIATY